MIGMLKCLLIISTLISTGHPVHFSVLNLEYSREQSIFNLTLKVFKDDFHLMAFHRYGDFSSESAINDSVQSDAFVSHYFNTMIYFVVNQQDTMKLQLTNKTIDQDNNLWLYFKVPVHKPVKRLDVTNYVLMDIFEDQSNLVIFGYNGQENGYQLTYEKPSFTYQFLP